MRNHTKKNEGWLTKTRGGRYGSGDVAHVVGSRLDGPEPVFVGTVTLHGFLRVFPKNIFIIA